MKRIIYILFMALAVSNPAHATDNISSSEQVSEAGALFMDRRNPSDIHIYGEFKSGAGSIAWRPGLTLRDAIRQGGGFKSVAHGVRIYLHDDVSKKRLDVPTRNIRIDPKILDSLIEQGDGVNAWTEY